MEVRVKQVEGLTFLGQSGSGHGIIMDAAPEVGGQNLGPRPMEMLLLGMGGCSSIDVKLILDKMRTPFDDVEVKITAERADQDPKVFTKIQMHFTITGKNIDPSKVERAVSLSAEKYCSASIMLGAMAEVTHSFEIVEPQ